MMENLSYSTLDSGDSNGPQTDSGQKIQTETMTPPTLLRKRVLVVEDDLTVQPALTAMIRMINPEVKIDWVETAEEAIQKLKAHQMKRSLQTPLGERIEDDEYCVVLSDVMLAGEKSGSDLVNECYHKRISADIILATSLKNFATKLPLIQKPYRLSHLNQLLSKYLGTDPALNIEKRHSRLSKLFKTMTGLIYSRLE